VGKLSIFSFPFRRSFVFNQNDHYVILSPPVPGFRSAGPSKDFPVLVYSQWDPSINPGWHFSSCKALSKCIDPPQFCFSILSKLSVRRDILLILIFYKYFVPPGQIV